MKIGYARVSTSDQSLDRQLDALKAYGCEQIYAEKQSGAKDKREELDRLLDHLRPGDVVVVVSLDRISRSTKHLIELADQFEKEQVEFVSLKESIDTTTPQGRFFYKVVAAFAELERELISERTKDGLAAARARGNVGGRPKTDPQAITDAINLYSTRKYKVSDICEKFHISRPTFYKYLKSYQENQKSEK